MSNKKLCQKFKEMKKTTFVYKASIVYPYVNFTKDGDNYIIQDSELCEVISYAENYCIL